MNYKTKSILASILISTSVLSASETVNVDYNSKQLQENKTHKESNSEVSVTFTDIKVALYNLLEDSAKNRKEINKLVKITDSLKVQTGKIDKIKERLKNNTERIVILTNKQKKLEKQKILYKDAIEKFIKNNKYLLPEE